MRSAMPATALVLAAISLAACGCSSMQLDGDAGRADAPRDADARPPECEWGQYWVYDWTLDGQPGTTGCKPGSLFTAYSPERDFYYASFEIDPAWIPDPVPWGLPDGFCGFPVIMENTPLVSGTSGPVLLGLQEYWVSRPRASVRVPLSYDGVGDGGPCTDEPGFARAIITGGTWHVLQGSSAPEEPLGVPGDWIEIEVRDLTAEPLDGHEIRFDRLYFRVRVREVGRWEP